MLESTTVENGFMCQLQTTQQTLELEACQLKTYEQAVGLQGQAFC